MPEDPRNVYERAVTLADSDGRLPVPMYVVMPQFPYEGELYVKQLVEPTIPEPPRRGEDGPGDCPRCEFGEEGTIWVDDDWLLAVEGTPSGLPIAIMVQPKQHLDLGQLNDEQAGELGKIIVHLERAVQSLGSIGRVHVARWGDTDVHLNVFVYARPEGFGQLRGACLTLWEDILPPTPQDVWWSNHKAVAERFAESMGRGTVTLQYQENPQADEVASRLGNI